MGTINRDDLKCIIEEQMLEKEVSKKQLYVESFVKGS